MSSYKLLSGSTNGKPIKVTGTDTGSANTIHTAVTGTDTTDIIRLFASNTTSSVATITIEFGGTTDPDDLAVKDMPIAANSVVPIVVNAPINNSLVIKAFSDTANAINIMGEVFNETI